MAPARAPFAHEAERACAELLDRHGVRWRYEPETFPLREDAAGRVVEALTPDFHLPDLGLYIEVTAQRQVHVGRKRAKARRFRERYPERPIVLITRRDLEHLVARSALRRLAA